ncbi:hypothetical protein BHM03_00048070 [Ensete ventricosum]|nr:hypothetical protein BHM03_00048070 [Ensete ventricosum]
MGSFNVPLCLLLSDLPAKVIIHLNVSPLNAKSIEHRTPSNDDRLPVSPVQHQAAAAADVIVAFNEMMMVCSNCKLCALGEHDKCLSEIFPQQPRRCNVIYGLISRCMYAGASNTGEYIPVTPVKYLTLANVPGGVLAGYHQCSDCRCCSANNRKNCVTTKCCYKLICSEAINPAAKCSFKPTACNCHNCS